MEKPLKSELLRTTLRNNSKVIVGNIIENYIQRNKKVLSPVKICMFCGSTNEITKEHVLPRWLFEKDTKRFFVTDINGLEQTYNKTTIPACANCNSDILNTLEKHINHLLRNRNIKENAFSKEEIGNIIRWLELIDYKFQILDVIRKFKASKQGGYIHYLANFPISVLRANTNYSPTKVVAEIRRSQKRITSKRKELNLNSLISFKTYNQSFYFFHQMNDFIFIELPKQQIALFYFYVKKFKDKISAYEEAMAIIREVYK